MKHIKSQHLGRDFRDRDVRRLDGHLHDSLRLIESCIQKIEELKATRSDISLQEIQQEGLFSYEFQMIPDFSKYFESVVLGESNMLRIFSSKNKFTIEESKKIGESIGIKWDKSPFSAEQFCMGLDAEHNEHGTDPETDVTHGNVQMEGKIAWAHLKEMSDYYTRLKRMESES